MEKDKDILEESEFENVSIETVERRIKEFQELAEQAWREFRFNFLLASVGISLIALIYNGQLPTENNLLLGIILLQLIGWGIMVLWCLFDNLRYRWKVRKLQQMKEESENGQLLPFESEFMWYDSHGYELTSLFRLVAFILLMILNPLILVYGSGFLEVYLNWIIPIGAAIWFTTPAIYLSIKGALALRHFSEDHPILGPILGPVMVIIVVLFIVLSLALIARFWRLFTAPLII